MAEYALIPVGVLVGIYAIRKLREYQWGWVRNTSSLKGKMYIVTGANTGLGFETTKDLVKRQATVILACRNLDRANDAITKIRQETNKGVLVPLLLDLASFDSIRAFATKIKNEYPTFDCLINNAGLALITHENTKENFEMTFGTNHLGHFYLYNLLQDKIRENKSRIVVVSSTLHQRGKIDFEKLGKFTKPVSRTVNPCYNDSKLANFYFARELYKQGMDVYVLCPGMCSTDVFRSYEPKWYHLLLLSPILWLVLRSANQGAQNIVHCATEANINTDDKNPVKGYFIQSLKQSKSKYQFDDEISTKLWMESEQMCGHDISHNFL